MKNYLIVTDTTSAMNSIQAKEYGVELVSLSVLIDRIEYKDQLDITTGEFTNGSIISKIKRGLCSYYFTT